MQRWPHNTQHFEILTRDCCQDQRKIVVPLVVHDQGYQWLMAHPEEARLDPSAMTELHYAMMKHAAAGDAVHAVSVLPVEDTDLEDMKHILDNEPKLGRDPSCGDPLSLMFRYLESPGNNNARITQVHSHTVSTW